MYAARRFAVRHAAMLEYIYRRFERVLLTVEPLLARCGYGRLERPVAWLETRVKGALFDCQMCGRCALGTSGMSCPMNCPKQLRNGPCGGVRQDGCCEVRPDMPCVWVQAHAGAARMAGGARILEVQPPVDRRLAGSSSWLRELRRLAEAHAGREDAAGAGAGR